MISIDTLPRLRSHAGNHDRMSDHLRRVYSSALKAICAVRGHNFLLHYGRGHMCLRCPTCGHETPGRHIGEPRVRTRFQASPLIDQGRHAKAR